MSDRTVKRFHYLFHIIILSLPCYRSDRWQPPAEPFICYGSIWSPYITRSHKVAGRLELNNRFSFLSNRISSRKPGQQILCSLFRWPYAIKKPLYNSIEVKEVESTSGLFSIAKHLVPAIVN